MPNRLLAIDTVTAACSVGLFDDGQPIAHDYREIGRGHAEQLVPMIDALPDNGKAENILVNCGPGSFTGVRIGISAAKALALAWNANLQGYACLHLVAAQALEQMDQRQSLYIVMVGGHGEYFVQNFRADGTALDELESLPSAAAIAKNRSGCWAGSAAIDLSEQTANIQAMSILPDAQKSLHINDADRQLSIAPIYGRGPDAKLPGSAGDG